MKQFMLFGVLLVAFIVCVARGVELLLRRRARKPVGACSWETEMVVSQMPGVSELGQEKTMKDDIPPVPEVQGNPEHYAAFRRALDTYADYSGVKFSEDEAIKLYLWREYWSAQAESEATR